MSLLLTALLRGDHLRPRPGGFVEAADGRALWTTLQQRLYRAFATVGGPVEIGALLSTAGWPDRGVAWGAGSH